MKYSVSKYYLILFFAFIGWNTSFAQFNFKVGYQAGYTDPTVFNLITAGFNTRYPFLEKELKPINLLHGIQIGMRYRWEYVGFEFTWYNRYRSIEANGVWPTTETDFRRELYFRTTSYSLSMENYFGPFGWGGSIDFDNLTLRTEHSGGRRDRYRIIGDKDNGWSPWAFSSHFYLMYNHRSTDFLSLSFRPYIQYYWQTHDLTPFQENLIPTPDGMDIIDRKERFMNFGLMIVFYNGYQE